MHSFVLIVLFFSFMLSWNEKAAWENMTVSQGICLIVIFVLLMLRWMVDDIIKAIKEKNRGGI